MNDFFDNPPPASVPRFPDGYIPADRETHLLSWEHVENEMRSAGHYWISTTRPDGRPHVTPVWGVWVDRHFYFDGSPDTRRGRNLAENPAIAVHLESGERVLILEGEARQMIKPDHSLTERIAASYREKYTQLGYAPGTNQWDQGGLYKMIPMIVFAWTDFMKDPTRWILS